MTISEFRKHPGQTAVMLLILLFLLAFLVIPVVQVVFVAFMDATTGGFTLLNFKDFFNTALFRESFWNSLYVGGHVRSGGVAIFDAPGILYLTLRIQGGGHYPESRNHPPDNAALCRGGRHADALRPQREC